MRVKRRVGTVVIAVSICVLATGCPWEDAKVAFQAARGVEEASIPTAELAARGHLSEVEIQTLPKVRLDSAIADVAKPADGLTEEQAVEMIDETCTAVSIIEASNKPPDEQAAAWLSAAGFENRSEEAKELGAKLLAAHNSPDAAYRAAEGAICYWAGHQEP